MKYHYQCGVCGKKFRSYTAEAKHRHNFPALCNRKSPAFKAWAAEREGERTHNLPQDKAV